MERARQSLRYGVSLLALVAGAFLAPGAAHAATCGSWLSDPSTSDWAAARDGAWTLLHNRGTVDTSIAVNLEYRHCHPSPDVTWDEVRVAVDNRVATGKLDFAVGLHRWGDDVLSPIEGRSWHPKVQAGGPVWHSPAMTMSDSREWIGADSHLVYPSPPPGGLLHEYFTGANEEFHDCC
jgi:hypothetical protein